MKTEFNEKDMVRVVYIDKSGEEQSIIVKAEKDYVDKAYLKITISTKTGILYGLYSGQTYNSVVSIEVTEKHYPKANYAGAEARICDLVADNSNFIRYVRLAGQEDMVRSITAVIMQGRMKMNNHNLYFEGANYVRVFPSGMRRIIKPIGEGMVDCILYHQSLIPDIGMSALFHMGDDCFEAFRKFLQILPIPRIYRLDDGEILERQIFDRLTEYEVMKKATTHVGVATISTIDIEKLEKDDYAVLRDAIIEILESRGYQKKEVVTIESVNNIEEMDVNQNIPVPKYLNDCPEYGVTDGDRFKKVHAKFFSPSMTWYITEYERETGICFGYVENLGDSYCSEWGTFYHNDLAQFKNKYPFVYVERDLHFGDDVYIDIEGNLHNGKPSEQAA